MPSNKQFISVDEYVSVQPKEVKQILKKIIKIIKEVASESKDLITYQMPTFELNGHRLYFAAFKKHIGFYAIYDSNTGDLEKELTPYRTTKDTVQFKFNEPIPYDLIKKVVEYKLFKD